MHSELAKLRCQEENVKLERMWHELLNGRTYTVLSQRQISALAGELYRETVAAHRENPGRPFEWEAELERLEKRRKRRITLVPLNYHLRTAFGEEVNAFLEKREFDFSEPTPFRCSEPSRLSDGPNRCAGMFAVARRADIELRDV